jgi:hypothetical protein
VNPIQFMRVFVDGQAEFFTFFNTVDAQMMLTPGAHNLIILATDTSNNEVSTQLQVNVSQAQNQSQPAVFSDIQAIPNWEGCSAKYPPGHPRAGQICAAGLGDAVATMTENVSSPPPVSGSSPTVAHFTIGGPTGYTNELWTKYFAGGSAVSHFTYDMYVMIDDATRSQALEFDVNQGIGNDRWTFGTECNFKGSGKPIGEWDLWQETPGWQPQSGMPCDPKDFPPNQWVHLTWQFARVGNQVQYISLTLSNPSYGTKTLTPNAPAGNPGFYSNWLNWNMPEIDVAFQMDGDASQQPYNVWLDKVTLTAW